MICASCGHENPARARYCSECGEPLGRTCPHCAADVPAAAKFCLECGGALRTVDDATPVPDPRSYTPKHLADKILQSRSALEGERKHVTVLFADVSGSMEVARLLDAEEWHAVLDEFFRILSDGVHRYEGTVNQYTGDGIMALFGAPIAHEDHAQRACLASLELREALRAFAEEMRRTRGVALAARIGLNSGEVVVGKIGDDLRMDYTAQGHVVGLAQRMEQLASPGAVCVTPSTAALVEGYVTLRSLGEHEVKGEPKPLEVFELDALGALETRIHAAQARGFSRFVGRAAELATLEAALERGLEDYGQTVGVVADAGVGKSRLCFEFLERCRARGFAIFETRGVAHGRHVPLLPMLALFRAYFEIGEGDSETSARQKIGDRLLSLDPGLRGDLPTFFDVLGVPDPEAPLPALEPEAAQRRAHAAVRAIVRAEGRLDKPAIMFVEDLHWLDAASDAYLAQIVEATAASRGLTLVTFRPEYGATWMQTSSYQQLPLVPLGADAVRDLVADVLGEDASTGEIAALLHDRTRGNPFFIEEIVQTLVETGALEGRRGHYRLVRPIDEATIPATVQNVLAARVDRLPEREKRLLQQAAVIGKTVPERVLLRVCGLVDADARDAIHMLQGAELLREVSIFPHVEYTFKHPLTHEVAYRSQLKDRRADTHASVARALEDFSEDRLDEAAALVAWHWEEAGAASAAARWHARAARWVGLSNYSGAYAHWKRVAELTRDEEDSAEAITLRAAAFRSLLLLAFRVETTEEEEAAVFAEGMRFLERVGDDASLAILTTAYSALRQNAGAIDEYLELADEAVRIAERSGDPAARTAAGVDRIWALYLKGRLAESIAFAAEVRRWTGGDVRLGLELGYSVHVVTHLFTTFALVEAGRLHEAETEAARTLELALELGPEETRSWSHVVGVFLAVAKGECGPSLIARARLAVEAAEKAGSQQAPALSNLVLSIAAARDEQWELAVAAAEEALGSWRGKRMCGDFAALMLVAHARGLQGAGDNERALDAADEALAVAQRQRQPVHEVEAVLTRAQCFRASQGVAAVAEIEPSLVVALKLIDETGAERWRPHVHAERAKLHDLGGDSGAAEREREEARRLFVETGATGYALTD